MALVAASALAVCFEGGCSPPPGPPGVSCSQDSDCEVGLECLPFEVPPDSGTDGGCSSPGQECLLPCQTTPDCATGGVGLVCFAACGGTPACEPGGYDGIPVDAEPPSEAGTTSDQ
jgi:hypothetical protein